MFSFRGLLPESFVMLNDILVNSFFARYANLSHSFGICTAYANILMINFIPGDFFQIIWPESKIREIREGVFYYFLLLYSLVFRLVVLFQF